jgi:hypothetical protein
MGKMKELMMEVEEALAATDIDAADAETIARIKLAAQKISEAVMILSGGQEVFDASNLPVSEAIACVRTSIASDAQLLVVLQGIISRSAPILKVAGF